MPFSHSPKRATSQRPGTSYGLARLPTAGKKPRPGGAGSGRAVFWAVIALLLVGSAAFWLTRSPEKKELLREEAAEKINDALSGTPLAGMGDILRNSPSPPPPEVTSPPTEAGTLSGRTITGTLASPIDLAASQTAENSPGHDENSAADENAVVFSQEPLKPVTEDSTVRQGYLAEIASWLAARYKPGNAGGTLAMNMQALNNLGGITIAGQAKGGRDSLLKYAFHPGMLEALYHLYIDRFMDDLDAAARQRGLDATQNRHFHQAVAGRATLVATALDGIAALPDLSGRLGKIDSLARQAVEINEQLAQAVFELDELRAAKAATSRINTVQMRVDGLTARYRRAMDAHADAQRTLAEDIRKNSGQSLDEDSLLFLAAWVERRLTADASAEASIKTCANILRNLAERCVRAGS